MPLEFTAIYENGILKPDQPLPFGEHERVTVVVRPRVSHVDESAGLMHWEGSSEELECLLAPESHPWNVS